MSVKDILREYKVNIGDGIAGIVAVPENAITAPGVLLLHGFASHKDEVGDLYKRLAVALAAQRIVSLRIDFRGCGESAGDLSDTTIDQQVADAQTGYKYLAGLFVVDSTRIGVVGFSLGGAIAVLSAAQRPEQYGSMALWSPVGDFKADFTRSLGQANVERALSEGSVTVDLGWRTVTLKDAFFKDLDRFDLRRAISRYRGALLVIAGRADPLAAYVDGYLAGAAGETKESLIIDSRDHIFGVLGADQTPANTVIEKTASWFRRTL
jgi:uncharacterized protein